MPLNGLEESDSSGLSFDSHDDAVNFINKSVQDSLDWLAVHNQNIADDYMSGKVDVRLHCRTLNTAEEYHFVFRPIPTGREKLEASSFLNFDVPEVNERRADCDRCEDAVFVGVAEFVECPEKIVPSFVWLESANEIDNLLWKRFATSFQGRLKIGSTVREREVGVTTFGSPKSVTSLVESRPQVVNSIGGNSLQARWHGLNELDLVRVLASVRLTLDEGFVGLSFEEFGGLPFEIIEVIVSPLNASF